MEQCPECGEPKREMRAERPIRGFEEVKLQSGWCDKLTAFTY